MAVLKAKAEKFVPFMFNIVKRELDLPLLTQRVTDDTFKGAQGDTVTMTVGNGFRTRARKYNFRDRVSPIVLDDISNDTNKLAITLDTHTYSATGITDEQATLDDIQWTTEVIQPQAEAVARDLNQDIRKAFNSIRFKWYLEFNDGDDPLLFVIEADRILDQGLVADRGGRYWLVGANVEASIRRSERLTRFDYSGPLANTALAGATIGSVGGMRVVRSDSIDPNFSRVMHSSTVVLGTVAPVIPSSVKSALRISKDSFGMRWMSDYDSNFLQDRSIVSLFSGITVVYDERIGGYGENNMELKPIEPGELPVSTRGLEVRFTPSAASVGKVPGSGLLGQTSGNPDGGASLRQSAAPPATAPRTEGQAPPAENGQAVSTTKAPPAA